MAVYLWRNTRVGRAILIALLIAGVLGVTWLAMIYEQIALIGLFLLVTILFIAALLSRKTQVGRAVLIGLFLAGVLGLLGMATYSEAAAVSVSFLLILVPLSLIKLIHSSRVNYLIIFWLLFAVVLLGVYACVPLFSAQSGEQLGSFETYLSMAGIASIVFWVILFLIFMQIPGFLLSLFIIVALLHSFFLIAASGSERGFTSYFYFAVGIFLLSLSYFPRNLEWKRYFMPQTAMQSFPTPRNEEKGFTLIELLIVIALLGIMAGGTLQVWAACVRSQHELEQRTQITQILGSQMQALMITPEPLSVSEEMQALPIALQEFQAPPDLMGGYRVEQAGDPNLLEITVYLTHGIDASTQRHYRLVGFHRKER